MTARDDLLAALAAERYGTRPRPVDTLAPVVDVGRVPWRRVFGSADPLPAPNTAAAIAERRAELLAATEPADDHAARLLDGVTKEPR
jgi:hypothetical protein